MSLVKILTASLFVMFASPALAQKPGAPKEIDGPGSTLSQSARTSVPGTQALPYGLQLMARFDLLPVLRDTKCVQDSSYDRSGGNGDSGNFFHKDGNKAVLSDIKGPGCVYRFWSANAAGHLKVYFDGEAEPRIDCQMQDLFNAKYAPFVAPIVGHKSGGWYCFFPMPFQKSCRFEVTDPGNMYYHVEYQLFPFDTKIESFSRTLSASDQTALDTVLKQWGHLGEDPKPAGTNVGVAKGDRMIAAGSTARVVALRGPGEVRSIRFKIDPADRATLRSTVIRVYWDGARKPAIEAPIGEFFGVGFGVNRYKAMPSALTDDGGVCYWPMPFSKAARFEITNYGKTPLKSVSWNVAYDRLASPMKDVGYFNAQWHRQTTVRNQYFHILQAHGRGHYVGEHTDMQGDRGIGFLEGDEKIYTDGELFPSIYGTGTEDFYTSGWYFDEGPFNQAYHGCIIKSDELSRISAYRYQIQDCVPFQKDLTVDIEHGGTNDYPGADYSCVAYWYQESPEHDWSPIDPAELTPARYHVENVTEAESLKWLGAPASGDVRDDLALPEEASGGKVVALAGAVATHSSFTLHVDKDDVYKLRIAELITADSPTRLDIGWADAAVEAPMFGIDLPANKKARYTYEIPVHLTAGDHVITLFTPAGKTRLVDWVQTVPAGSHDKGVIEAESLAGEAMKISDGHVDTVDTVAVVKTWGRPTMDALSGYGLLEWTPDREGARLKLPVTVADAGDYELELGFAMLSPGGAVSVLWDDAPVNASVDLSKLTNFQSDPAKYRTQYLRIGRIVNTAKGAHTITIVENGAAFPLRIDALRIQRSLYPNTVEAENLKVLDSKDGEAKTQALTGTTYHWSGDNQFWFTGNKQGAEATLLLPVALTGEYDLSVYLTGAKDYAIVQVLLDGTAIGKPIDCYSTSLIALGRTGLGRMNLTAGDHKITFRAVSKNASSSNYLIGVDAIGMDPIR